MSLHPSIIDIRPILWVNYGTNKSKYSVNLRYTSYLDISEFKKVKKDDELKVYHNMSTARRQEIRYARKNGYYTVISKDSNKFIEFYKLTFERQNLKVSEKKLKIMKDLIDDLIELNVAKLYASYDNNENLGSMAFLGWDNKRAYFIFGASEPSKRKGHYGTIVLWDAFYDLSKIGINEIDLEGINSPYRGWFKLSFGGSIIPYFEVCL